MPYFFTIGDIWQASSTIFCSAKSIMSVYLMKIWRNNAFWSGYMLRNKRLFHPRKQSVSHILCFWCRMTIQGPENRLNGRHVFGYEAFYVSRQIYWQHWQNSRFFIIIFCYVYFIHLIALSTFISCLNCFIWKKIWAVIHLFMESWFTFL